MVPRLLLRSALALLIAVLTGWPSGVPTVQAASFTVNSTTDAVDASPGDGVCATAPLPNEGVRCTLRAAIVEANTSGGQTTITLPAGTFGLSIPGPQEDAAATGDLDILASLTIVGAGATQTIIDGNRLDRVFDVVDAGALNLRDVTVQNGLAPGGPLVTDGGGGIRTSLAKSLSSTLLTGVTVSKNEGAMGGGLKGPVTVRQSIISSNTATNGGGVGDGGAVIEDSVITGNRASDRGGGIEGSATIRRTTISLNTANNQGGGAFVDGTIDDSLITANLANAAGGIYNPSTLLVRNSTISGNTATLGGGGIIANAGGCIPRGGCFGAVFENVTVTENQSPRGSGVSLLPVSSAGATFTGSIVANNRISSNCGPSAISSGGYNLSTDDSCQLTAIGDRQNVAPLLGSLADNGGPTLTHALLPGSPAIDAGPTSNCPAADQRGQPRPVDGDGDSKARCDIGAFEAPTPPPGCVPRPPVQVHATPDGTGHLKVTISATANPGATNALQSIAWDSMANATVTLVGGSPVSAGQQTVPPAGAQTLIFLVGRQTAGQAATVRLTVADACGAWPTFVGGGPSAF